MIFNNLKLSDPSPKIELFLWQVLGRVLPENLDLSTGENDLKIALY